MPTRTNSRTQVLYRAALDLPPPLAAMYREVREQRESGHIDPERLEVIAAQARGYVDDWLLRTEIAELLTGESGFAEAPAAATY